MTVHLRPGPELDKAEREVAVYERFRDLVGQVTEVNEAICEARPAVPPGAVAPPPEVRGSARRSGMEAVAEVTRLAVLAAASLSLGQGLEEAAERVIQAGLTQLGAGVAEGQLAADGAYAGPRT